MRPIDRLIAHFLADRIGATFEGQISGVTKAGLFIKLERDRRGRVRPGGDHRRRLLPLRREDAFHARRAHGRNLPSRRPGARSSSWRRRRSPARCGSNCSPKGRFTGKQRQPRGRAAKRPAARGANRQGVPARARWTTRRASRTSGARRRLTPDRIDDDVDDRDCATTGVPDDGAADSGHEARISRPLPGLRPRAGSSAASSRSSDHARRCGTEFHHHRADDLPPYIVMFIVGHVVGYGILVTETGSRCRCGCISPSGRP